MIETIETGSPGVIGLRLCGKLHDGDYKQFVPEMETLLTGAGKVRLYIQLEDFHGWDMHAAWDDLKFGLKHYSDFERIAVVGDRKWEKWMANFFRPFTTAQMKYFDRADVDAAWRWLQESDEGNQSREKNVACTESPLQADVWGRYVWRGL